MNFPEFYSSYSRNFPNVSSRISSRDSSGYILLLSLGLQPIFCCYSCCRFSKNLPQRFSRIFSKALSKISSVVFHEIYPRGSVISFISLLWFLCRVAPGISIVTLSEIFLKVLSRISAFVWNFSRISLMNSFEFNFLHHL